MQAMVSISLQRHGQKSILKILVKYLDYKGSKKSLSPIFFLRLKLVSIIHLFRCFTCFNCFDAFGQFWNLHIIVFANFLDLRLV